MIWTTLVNGYGSGSLSPAEKNYSQLEKESLACVFGVKLFHSYLFSRRFTLATDHKPLLGLFNEKQAVPAQASDCSKPIRRSITGKKKRKSVG